MKPIVFSLLATTMTAGAVWLAYGGAVLSIILLTLTITTLLISAFGAGSWWSTRLIQQGATIALQAQTSDDRRDMVQINAIAGLVKETLKLRSAVPTQNTYPLLDFEPTALASSNTVDADFTIAGLEQDLDAVHAFDERL